MWRRFYTLIKSEVGDLFAQRNDESWQQPHAGGATPKDVAQPQATESQRDQKAVDYYANLELEYGASLREVKEAYRRLMKKYHPDLHARDESKRHHAEELSKRLNEAYRYLDEKLQQTKES